MCMLVNSIASRCAMKDCTKKPTVGYIQDRISCMRLTNDFEYISWFFNNVWYQKLGGSTSYYEHFVCAYFTESFPKSLFFTIIRLSIGESYLRYPTPRLYSSALDLHRITRRKIWMHLRSEKFRIQDVCTSRTSCACSNTSVLLARTTIARQATAQLQCPLDLVSLV